MSDKEVQIQCYLCQNQCQLIMQINADNIVLDAWKMAVKQDISGKKPTCKRLKSILNQDLKTAKGIIQKPRRPTIVAGGH